MKITPLLALLAPLTICAQEIVYQPGPFVPRAGMEFVAVKSERTENRTRVSAGDELLQEDERIEVVEYRVAVEILEVEDGEWSEAILSVEQASTAEGDLGLAGRTIRATMSDDGERTFEAEGEGDLTEEQVAWLEEEFGPQDEDLDAFFYPGAPIAVGDDWEIPIADLAEALEMELDAERSQARARLVEVESVEGVLHATIEFDIDLAPRRLEDLELLEGRMRIAGTLVQSLDGSTPFARTKMVIEFEGRAQVDDEGRTLDIRFAVAGSGQESLEPGGE